MRYSRACFIHHEFFYKKCVEQITVSGIQTTYSKAISLKKLYGSYLAFVELKMCSVTEVMFLC